MSNTHQRPHRAYEIDIHIGSDTWDGLLEQLQYLAHHIEEHGPICKSVMGGHDANHSVTIVHRPDMTNEKYFEQLDEYLSKKVRP